MRTHRFRNSVQIAIIGGNGFLGRAIIHRLSSFENLRIFSIDKRIHGVSIDTSNSKAIIQQITMDVGNENAINAFLMAHPVDIIIYTAGFENPSDGLGYTFMEETRALLGLENTLVALNDMDLESNEEKPYFIYLSSWTVYGPQKKVCNETTKEYPGNYAGMLKLCGEDLVKRICTKMNTSYCILRPTEIYGRKHYRELENDKFWPGYLCYYLDKILKREKVIEVFSPNTEIDFVNVNYFTKFLLQAIEKRITGIYNIASSDRLKIKDLVNKLLIEYNDSTYLPNIKYKKNVNIENVILEKTKTETIVPYDFNKYDLNVFIKDYIPLRRYELAKAMAIEETLKTPVIYDSSSLQAKEAYMTRQARKKLSYSKIKQVAGDQFFKLNVGNITKRAEELEKLEFDLEILNKGSKEEQNLFDRSRILNQEESPKTKIKKSKKKK